MNMGKHAKEQDSILPRSILNIVLMVTAVVVLSTLLRTFVFEPYEIPSGSMRTTIVEGDMVFSQKLSYYMGEPQAGDIVTFEDPSNENRVLIKRCIAVAGQEIDIRNGELYIDGVVQEEPYTNNLQTIPLASDITYPYVVPEGCICVMGDNRTHSQDSRYFGAIPVSSVSGKAFMIYWPLNRISLL